MAADARSPERAASRFILLEWWQGCDFVVACMRVVWLQVHVIASLPCYEERNVDVQRGASVFARSIRALLKLNQRGYAHSARACVGQKKETIGALVAHMDSKKADLRCGRLRFVCRVSAVMARRIDGVQHFIGGYVWCAMGRYGVPGSGLELSLVYNPIGAYLPPPQAKLEEQYKVSVTDRHRA